MNGLLQLLNLALHPEPLTLEPRLRALRCNCPGFTLPNPSLIVKAPTLESLDLGHLHSQSRLSVRAELREVGVLKIFHVALTAETAGCRISGIRPPVNVLYFSTNQDPPSTL